MIIISVVLTFVPLIIYFRLFGIKRDNDLINLWGTCSAGISSALITLASVAITVKETRRVQKENNTDTKAQITAEHNERLKKEHRELINTVSIYIGKYITHTQIYFESALVDYDLKTKLENKKCRLQKCRDDQSKKATQTDDMTKHSNNTLSLLRDLQEEEKNLEREIYVLEQKIQENSEKGRRTVALECYFILKTQLSDIKEAADFLKQLKDMHDDITQVIARGKLDENWVMQKSDNLIHSFQDFRKKYESIP